MSNESLRAEGMPGASPRSCGNSTQGPVSATTSTCSASPSGTWRWSTSGIAILAGYREHLAELLGSRPRSSVHPLPSVPCHNDLLAENYLDDGERLWLVDWEYSGNNDPTFELGNTAQELGYDDDQIAEPRAAYFGEPPRHARPDAPEDDHVRRRLDALGRHPGSDLDLDSDFTAWAEERWVSDRLQSMGPDFEGVARGRQAVRLTVLGGAAGFRRPGGLQRLPLRARRVSLLVDPGTRSFRGSSGSCPPRRSMPCSSATVPRPRRRPESVLRAAR